MKSFNIHLASNVSPNLFPNNNASNFSTNLANQIDLSDGEWEVGVRQIMYPTHIATTTLDEKIEIYKYDKYYRDFLPFPDSSSLYGAFINVNPDEQYPKDTNNLKACVDYILKKVNESTWVKDKNAFQLDFKARPKKFVLRVIHKDLLLMALPELAKLLGFKQTCFMKGTYRASYRFLHEKQTIKYESQFRNLTFYLYDVNSLDQKTYTLNPSHVDDVDEKVSFNATIPYHVPHTDNLVFDFGIYPNDGFIKRKPGRYSYYDLEKQKYVLVYFFDKESTKKLNLDNFYCYREDVTEIKIPLIPVQSSVRNHVLDLKSVKVTFVYLHLSKNIGKADFDTLPIENFSINNNESISNPSQLLPLLNKHSQSYHYNFDYNVQEKRFTLSVAKDYGLRLSQSLATILGMDLDASILINANITASHFPLLNRAITSLYIYTNIIDSIYVGNIQAPLLLVCPFKGKNSKDNVHQIEFRNPAYTPINHTSINHINIKIYDDCGALVPFLYGKTNLTLHFRRKF